MMDDTPQKHVNTPRQVLFASMVGTTVEFFDFYIYATAAVLVFPQLFFPASNPAASTLASLATFGIAFVARPIGSALFGHFGDRIGRKRACRRSQSAHCPPIMPSASPHPCC
jgi:MFS family permease